MRKTPFLSVIIPIYQTEKYLERCVESVLAQSFKDFEVILVDDGSTDGSADICDEYARKDARIRVIHKENGGLVSARKAGIFLAKGTYITHVDSDDRVEKSGFAKMAKAARRTQADILLAALKEYQSGNCRILGNTMPEGLYTGKKLLQVIKQRLLFDEVLGQFAVQPSLCCKWIKRKVVYPWQMRVDERIALGEDAACSFPSIWSAESIYVTPYAYYCYEIRGNSMTREHSQKAYEKIDILSAYMKGMQKLFAEEILLERQLARYRLYLIKGTFEKELSPHNKVSIQKKLSRITAQMKKVNREVFEKAELGTQKMNRLDQYIFQTWKKERFLQSAVLLCILKAARRCGYGTRLKQWSR